MKKCGRFVAGMFGTSLSLAMLSGAFLMANKGAVEAEAATEDGSISFSLTYSSLGEKGNDSGEAVKTIKDETGVYSTDFKYTVETRASFSSSESYVFVKSGQYLTNISAPNGYYLSNVSGRIADNSGMSTTAKPGLTFSSEPIEQSHTDFDHAISVERNSEFSFDNDDTSVLYANISSSAKNAQIAEIVYTFSQLSFDHITISGEPTKTDYYVGDSFLTDGLTVYAYLTAEETNPVDVTDSVEWIIDPETFDDTLTTSVDLLAEFNGIVSDIYTVDGLTVSPAATVADLIVTPPTKTVYGYGEDIDLSGLKIEAKMSDGATTDVTSEILIAEHTINLEDVIAGKYDIAISYKDMDKTLSLTVDEEILTIAEARSTKSEVVVFAGTITGITGVYSNSEDVNVFIADSTGAILLYRFNESIVEGGELAVGNKVYVAAKVTVYNGLVETSSGSIAEIYVSGKGEEITAKPVVDLSADSLEGLDSSLISVEGLTYVEGSVGSSSGAQSITLKHNGSNVTMRAPTNVAAGVLAEAGLDEWFTKTSGLPFNFTGHLGWFNNPQLAPISMDDFACPVYDEIKVFIDTYMHMDKNDKDQCLTLFPEAKEAFDKLSETARECFLKYKGDNQEIVSASARYHAWQAAQGDQNAASVIMNTVNENKGTVIAVSAVAALGVAGAVALLISRKKRSAKNK